MSPFQEYLFCLCNSIFNCYFRIFWKIVISDNQLMELISKIISACRPSMPVIYCKKWASWPFINIFKLRFNDIKNDRNSVFVIISNNALMRISRVAWYHAIFLACELCRMVWANKPFDLLMLHFDVFLLLLCSHDEPSVGH